MGNHGRSLNLKKKLFTWIFYTIGKILKKRFQICDNILAEEKEVDEEGTSCKKTGLNDQEKYPLASDLQKSCQRANKGCIDPII